jgi:hypothetical protein
MTSFSRFFLTIVVVQNVPLDPNFQGTPPFQGTPLFQGDNLYYYYSKKKALKNEVTYCDVTSGYDVTSGHVTYVTSGRFR